MKELKKGTKKINKPMQHIQETGIDERGCKQNKCHEEENKKKVTCECECVCTPKPICEPCEIDAGDCIDLATKCGTQCCSPIAPPKFNPANSVPYAIEASVIYDTMQFQTFTDGLAENGAPLTFDYDVVEVRGPVPRGGFVNIVIDKVCLNYSSITIDPGVTTLENFELELVESTKPCETNFEYVVCIEKNSTCNDKCLGQKVVYKQKGLTVTVEGLVLELIGHCGCTEVVVLAHPTTKTLGGPKHKCVDVEFIFNTLSAPICCPADGRGVTLRQDFDINLSVDCIGKALLKYVETECCECFYEFCIPNDIDLLCCLQETVSILTSEQVVVLGSPIFVQPRIVDTFTKVCDFSNPACNNTASENNCKKHCGC